MNEYSNSMKMDVDEPTEDDNTKHDNTMQDFLDKEILQNRLAKIEKEIDDVKAKINFILNHKNPRRRAELIEEDLPDLKKELEDKEAEKMKIKEKIYESDQQNSIEPDVAEKAFNTSYKDPHYAVQHFISYLQWCHKEWWDAGGKVAPFVPIVQSSGYGKTRMIAHIAERVYVLYICKRPRYSTGFPSASPLVDWVLEELVPTSRDLENFAVIMLAAVEVIEELAMEPGKFWKMQIENRSECEKFWYQIKERYMSYLSTTSSRVAAKLAIADNSFISKHKFGEGVGGIQLLCCLDEAHELIDDSKGDSRSLKFRIWRRGIRSIEWKGLFSVCLSTSGKINNFHPRFELDPSARSVPFTLFQPFFDVATIDALVSDMPEYPTPEQLAYYGRPLFGALISKGSGIMRAVQLAKMKLEGTTGDGKFASLALLACLAAVKFSPLATFAQTLVADHMATVLGVSADRSEVYLTYPSEPFLAAGALYALNKNEKWVNAINTLTDAVHRGVAHGGECGEIVVRLALLRAMHLCSATIFGNPITVRRFFTRLLWGGENFVAKRQKMDRSNPPKVNQKECIFIEDPQKLNEIFGSFGDGEIAFNHFLTLNERLSACQIDPELFKACWKRRAAITLPRNTKSVDLVLPVRLANGVYSCIAIQVKNLSEDRPSDMSKNAAKMEEYISSQWSLDNIEHLNLYITLRHKHEGVFGHASSADASSPKNDRYLFVNNFRTFAFQESLLTALDHLCTSEIGALPDEVLNINYYNSSGKAMSKTSFNRRSMVETFLRVNVASKD
ncbi:uncharacterized protein VTP21DRAFT_10261 [Calcarisporiella thermophila]|uniref:uncharacterized protein n=1 Tax=Calcarisporiella thermophila TaxID=911321 RepID=UPI0037438C88